MKIVCGAFTGIILKIGNKVPIYIRLFFIYNNITYNTNIAVRPMYSGFLIGCKGIVALLI